MPRKIKSLKTYAELPAEVQMELNELAHESVVFRRSRAEFDALVQKKFRGEIHRDSARERLQAAVEAFGLRTPRVTAEEKDAQRERVLSHIKKAEAAGQWMAAAKLESLFADLMGTREPIKIEHTFRGALHQVVEGLTPEIQAEIIAKQRRAYELAALAEKEGLARALPAPKMVEDAEIVVEAETIQKIA